MRQSNNHLVLYAQNCPDQPIIPKTFVRSNPSPVYQNQIQDSLSQATRVITQKKYLKQSRPKIIRNNRIPYHHSYQLREHERQVESMKKRIQNCKSLNQRKKDRNDPIVYPPYFIRNNAENNDLKIDAYTKKALNSTMWKLKQKQINKIYDQDKSRLTISNVAKKQSTKKYEYNLKPEQIQNRQIIHYSSDNPEREQQSQLPSPRFYKKQQVILKPIVSAPINFNFNKTQVLRSNLPANDIKSVLDYIYNHLLYKQKDLQALKSRMVHAYGKQEFKKTWKVVMRLLQRDV